MALVNKEKETDLSEPVGHFGYTESMIRDEYNRSGIGRPVTDSEITNWMKYGRPGQLLYSFSGGISENKFLNEEGEEEIRIETGNVVRIHKINKDGSTGKNIGTLFKTFHPDIPLWIHSGQSADLAGDWVDRFPVLPDRMRVNRAEDGRTHLFHEPKSEGFIGSVFGSSAEETFQKAFPKELIYLSDPTGISNRFLAGQDFVQRGDEALGDITGLKASEIREYTDLAVDISVGVAAVAFAPVTGGLSLAAPAALKAARYSSYDLAGADIDWADAGVDIGITLASSYAGAGYGQAGSISVDAAGTAIQGGDWEDFAVRSAVSLGSDWASQGNTFKEGLIRSGANYAYYQDTEMLTRSLAATAISGGIQKAQGGPPERTENQSIGDYLKGIYGQAKNPRNPFAGLSSIGDRLPQGYSEDSDPSYDWGSPTTDWTGAAANVGLFALSPGAFVASKAIKHYSRKRKQNTGVL